MKRTISSSSKPTRTSRIGNIYGNYNGGMAGDVFRISGGGNALHTLHHRGQPTTLYPHRKMNTNNSRLNLMAQHGWSPTRHGECLDCYNQTALLGGVFPLITTRVSSANHYFVVVDCDRSNNSLYDSKNLPLPDSTSRP